MRLPATLLSCMVLSAMTGCCRMDQKSVPTHAGHLPPERMTTRLPLGIIGETEVVYLPDFTVPFEARIDTGATTSSMDARDIRSFERDGRKWVSFRVIARNGGESRQYECPVVRTVRIKQHGGDSVERFCVMLTFRMGHLTLEREFTLADRSRFEYPVLVGRNILNGLAAVDPSCRNVL